MLYENKSNIKVDEEIMSYEELKEMITDNEAHIVFGEIVCDYLLEFDVHFKGDNSRIILIRNKYNDGSNGQPIPHEPTIKYINGKNYVHDSMLGLPVEVNNTGEIKFPKSLVKKGTYTVSDIDKMGRKLIKTILKEDGDTIYKYWYLDPSIPEEYSQMKIIENQLTIKYSQRII